MKLFMTIILLLLALLSLGVNIDEHAMSLHDEALVRATVAFGLAKALNGVISLIQGTQLLFSPVGVGVTISVGEILDPFNDMVERFSWIMLLASVSLGVQKLLLILSSKLFIQAAFLASIIFSVSLLWIGKIQNAKVFGKSLKILAVLLLLRFGAVLFVYADAFLYENILQNDLLHASKVVEQTKNELEAFESDNQKMVQKKEESNWYEFNMKEKFNFNITSKLRSMQANIEEASNNIVNIITVFVVQTVLMPLLFLWLFIGLIKWIFRIELDCSTILQPKLKDKHE